jgi:hypothetical protein
MCSISDFYLEVYAGNSNSSSNALAGETITVYVTVNNVQGQRCSCVTLAYTVNGVEFTRQDVCVKAGYYWENFGYLQAWATYVVPRDGTYNFCAEIVSVR